MSGPKVSDDGRFWWDGAKWVPFAKEPPPTAPADGGIATAIWVALGVLLAAAVIWGVYTYVHSDDDLDCAIRNAEHAQKGEPAEDCGS